MRRLTILACIAIPLLLASWAQSGGAGEKLENRYRYDPAGRLTRVDYEDGKGKLIRVTYEYDPAGNILSKRTMRGWDWQVAVKKPAAGAWLLTAWADGTVTGYGADGARGFYEIKGTLTLVEKTVSGSLSLVGEGGGAVLAAYSLAGSKVKRSKTGEPTKLTLTSPKTNPSGALKATATSLGAARTGFAGRYASSKNQVKVGKEKKALTEVVFAADGEHDCTCLLTGGVAGRLVRDAKGKAYGTVTHDGKTYVVSSKLKDGAKKVSVKTGKGVGVKVTMKLRQAKGGE